MSSLSFNMIIPMGSDRGFHQKKEIISKLCHASDADVHFPVYDPERPNFDLSEAISYVKKADFIIADLSLERPSCYYELGIAEVLTKEIHLIACTGTEIHQTSHRSKVHFYSNTLEFTNLVKGVLKTELNRVRTGL